MSVGQAAQAGSESHAGACETHTATVLFIADRVYKLKKPVNLGFLDFLKVRSPAKNTAAACASTASAHSSAAALASSAIPITNSSTLPAGHGTGQGPWNGSRRDLRPFRRRRRRRNDGCWRPTPRRP
jgi:hypothetical protein